MTRLVRPDIALAPSWIATLEDFGGWGQAHGSGYWIRKEPFPATEQGCREFIEAVLAAEPRDPTGASSRVPSTYYWVTDDDGEMVGFLNLRHELNDWLYQEGGHIGYSVRPSRRRQGHAVAALRLGVRRAAELGIDRVLVTCNTDNLASRRTIESGGGVYEDERNGKLRFWIPT